jgi:hypothetical protein
MEGLSNDTRFLLALQLDLPDIFSLAATCKAFSKLTKNDLLFRALFCRNFGQHLKVYTIADLREWCLPFNELHEGWPVSGAHVKMIEGTEQLKSFAEMSHLPAGWTWRSIYTRFYRTGASIRCLMREQAKLYAPISTTSNTKIFHLHPENWTWDKQINVITDLEEQPAAEGLRELHFYPIYQDPYSMGYLCADFEEELCELNYAFTPLEAINQALRTRAQQQKSSLARAAAAAATDNNSGKADVKDILAMDMICVKEGIACRVETQADAVIQYELIYPAHGLRHYLNHLKAQTQIEYGEHTKRAAEFLKQTLTVEHSLALPRDSTFTSEMLDQLQSYLVSYLRACELDATLLGTSFDQNSNTMLIQHQCTRSPHWMLHSDQCSFSYMEADYAKGTLTRTFCTSTAGVTEDQHLCNCHTNERAVPPKCSAPQSADVHWNIHQHEVVREHLMYPFAPHLKFKTDPSFMLKDSDGEREVPVLLHCSQVKVSNY